MKTHSLRYLTREGFRNITSNALMSLASVTVLLSCLLIIGCAVLLFVNINSMLSGLEEQNVILVYIDYETSAEDTEKLRTQLEEIENIATIEFVSKEEGFEGLKTGMSDISDLLDDLASDGGVFLPDSYRVTLKDIGIYQDTVQKIGQLDNIMNVRGSDDLATKLTTMRNAITNLSIGIIIILFFVAVFIIANTVRITMFSRRLEISIMKAVGATKWFIRWPFLIEGIILGIVSAFVSFGTVYFLYELVLRSPDSLADVLYILGSAIIPFGDVAWMILSIFLVIGVFTGAFGSFVSMGKYLKEQGVVNNEIENV